MNDIPVYTCTYVAAAGILCADRGAAGGIGAITRRR